VHAPGSEDDVGDDTRRRRRAEMMGAAQRGDAEAYGALLHDVGPLVWRFLRRRLAHAEDIEDAYQETFLALHRARHTYDPSRPIEPWLFAIAGHVAARSVHRRRRRGAWEVLVSSPPDGAVESDGAMGRMLAQALLLLPPAQRQALELLHLDGLSSADAAARARTSAGALRVRAHRAYKTLRQLLHR